MHLNDCILCVPIYYNVPVLLQTNACRTAMDASVGWLDTDFAACYTLPNN